MIEKLLKKIARRLDEDNIPYMIIGGQAVLVYGRPRLTRDIDVTLGVDTDNFPVVERVCKKLKLKILPEKPQNFAKETRVLPAEEITSNIRVDFVFSYSEYEKQALERTRNVLIGDYPVRFASCEDVIIHKMVAARAIDEEDIRSILIKNKAAIDLKYVKKWLSEFGRIPEYKGILGRFSNLLKQQSNP